MVSKQKGKEIIGELTEKLNSSIKYLGDTKKLLNRNNINLEEKSHSIELLYQYLARLAAKILGLLSEIEKMGRK